MFTFLELLEIRRSFRQCLAVAAAAAALIPGKTQAALLPLEFSGGIGMVGALSQQVNPSYPDIQGAPVLFFQTHSYPWSLAFDVALRDQASRTGNLQIDTSTVRTTLWGRYTFFAPNQWSPFVAAGGGAYFDRVKTSLGNDVDVRQGRRGILGLGLGVSQVFWRYFLVEGETLVLGVQGSRQPQMEFILRAGFHY